MRVPTGKGFTASERLQIDKAIRNAESLCRFEFSVYVGKIDGDPKTYAAGLHAALVAPTRSVLIAVDPGRHLLQVVTGTDVRRDLTDQEVSLAAVTMQSCFADGDYALGLCQGVRMLAEHATTPTTLHSS